MKQKITILVVLIGILFGMRILITSNNNQEDNMTLRVAFPYAKPLNVYEPTKIHYAPEYIFLENVFSPLIELHQENGDIVPGIADRFEWVGNELHFHIRDGIKTVSGIPITAFDAEFSLKRLLVKSGNTHGNFHDLMCIDSEIKKITDSCPGIRVEGNTLILAPGKKKEFLLPMVAALDFAIIPKGSVDPKTLDIIDYKNTSGPYFVKEDDGKGNIHLEVNPFHYHFRKNIPQTVILVPSGIDGYPSSIEQFRANKVDYITTIDKLPAEKVIGFSSEVKGATDVLQILPQMDSLMKTENVINLFELKQGMQ
jgi:ABC-type transport system substrate-binding protein